VFRGLALVLIVALSLALILVIASIFAAPFLVALRLGIFSPFTPLGGTLVALILHALPPGVFPQLIALFGPIHSIARRAIHAATVCAIELLALCLALASQRALDRFVFALNQMFVVPIRPRCLAAF
jgi:hypothetical protein